MKRLYTPTQHLRRLGNRRDIPTRQSAQHARFTTARDSLNLHPRLSNHLCGPARTEQPESELLQALGEGKETGLVVDGEQSDGSFRHCLFVLRSSLLCEDEDEGEDESTRRLLTTNPIFRIEFASALDHFFEIPLALARRFGLEGG